MRDLSRFALSLVCLLFTPSCNQRSVLPGSESADAGAGTRNDGFVRLTELSDSNPDPDTVEVTLTATAQSVEVIPGRAHEQLTYNGVIPGPLIRAKKGDTLIVHLNNELDDGTTIHWHGMRVPNGMDGVPGVTQPVVKAGKTFRYEFELLDASVFWYHPHYQTLEGVGAGLYGALLVEDPKEDRRLGPATVLAISDMSVFEDGSLQQHDDAAAGKIAGREGATLLLNGRPSQQMNVVNGQRLRWHVLNMARSRYLDLQMAGHSILRIGSDGGRMEFPVQEETTRLVPGERVELIVEARGEPGTFVDLVTLPVFRGEGAGTALGPEVLLRLNFVAGKPDAPPALPKLTRKLERFSSAGAQEVEIGLTMDTGIDGMLRMGINGIPWEDSAPLHAVIGQAQVWSIVNHSAYNHPFHLHGFHFQVLQDDGSLESPLRLKDTIDIPPLSTVKIVPQFEERPGKWMFHCHILDHAESGMMGVLYLHAEDELVDGGAPPTGWGPQRNIPPPVAGSKGGEVQEYLENLLESEVYLQAPWVAESEKPRPKASDVSPHGDVRVFANDVLQRSIAAGNSVKFKPDGTLEADFEAAPHFPGSIAVKELWQGQRLVGRAALLVLDGSRRNNTAYYCDGPPERCGTPSITAPVYGEGALVPCGACHAGMVFTTTYEYR